MLPHFFQRLCQVKTLRFQAHSLNGSQMGWNHSGEGVTQTQLENHVLTFHDTFTLDNGRLCQDWKQWRLEDEILAFYHWRQQAFEPILRFEWRDGLLHSQQPYLCQPDYYDGQLYEQNDEIVLKLSIVGKRKNEQISYFYR